MHTIPNGIGLNGKSNIRSEALENEELSNGGPAKEFSGSILKKEPMNSVVSFSEFGSFVVTAQDGGSNIASPNSTIIIGPWE